MVYVQVQKTILLQLNAEFLKENVPKSNNALSFFCVLNQEQFNTASLINHNEPNHDAIHKSKNKEHVGACYTGWPRRNHIHKSWERLQTFIMIQSFVCRPR